MMWDSAENYIYSTHSAQFMRHGQIRLNFVSFTFFLIFHHRMPFVALSTVLFNLLCSSYESHSVCGVPTSIKFHRMNCSIVKYKKIIAIFIATFSNFFDLFNYLFNGWAEKKKYYKCPDQLRWNAVTFDGWNICMCVLVCVCECKPY